MEKTFFKGCSDFSKVDPQDYQIDVKYIEPLKSEDEGVYRYYFLLTFSFDLISQMATYLNFQIYNLKKKYTNNYLHTKQHEYEHFRDFHTHEIIKVILNDEFNVEELK